MCLGAVLVHLVSLVVLVLDEIAVVVDPFVIAVSVVATRTVVAHVVFAAEIVGGCCCVKSCCLGTPCLERSSRSSRSAGDAIRSCSFVDVASVMHIAIQNLIVKRWDEHPLSWHVSIVLHQTVLSQSHTRTR